MTHPTGPARHAGGMNIYLINALLVLLVVRQIREHQLDLRALAVPVLAVGAAAVMLLHSVPGGGSDIALDLPTPAPVPGLAPGPHSPPSRSGAADRGALFMPPHGPVRLGRTEAEAMGLPASRQPMSGLVPREHQQLAAAGNASAKPAMPR